MIIRRSAERGFANHGWLRSYHTFSFADYYDPDHMGFRVLRVINEDRVAPGKGFGMHSHRDMEIISYVLAGELEHKDSMGNGTIIRPGDVQRMSAGTGVTHSEFNPSADMPVHFLQIWIVPERTGLPPSYEQKTFGVQEKRGRLCLVGSRGAHDGSVTIHQDVNLFAALLEEGQRVVHELAPGRHAWIHLARGAIELNGQHLEAGDAAGIALAGPIALAGQTSSEVLLFDMA